MNYANQVMHLKPSIALWGPLRKAAGTLLALLALTAFNTPAQAQLKIDITGVGANQIAFSAAPFQGNQGLPEDIKKVIEDDLVRSGFFRSINTTSNVELNESCLLYTSPSPRD